MFENGFDKKKISTPLKINIFIGFAGINGDNLKAKVDVEWRHHFKNGKTEKRKIKGSFETVIGMPKEDPDF